MHYFNYNEGLNIFTEIQLGFGDVVPEKLTTINCNIFAIGLIHAIIICTCTTQTYTLINPTYVKYIQYRKYILFKYLHYSIKCTDKKILGEEKINKISLRV